jgi:hypothetical protein
MDDSDSDSDSDSEDDDDRQARQLQDGDEEEDDDDQSLTDIDDDEDDDDDEETTADNDQRCLNLISLLQKKKEYPKRSRNKINRLTREFLQKLGNDVHDMLCDNIDDATYRGLDSDRDTEEEVEAIIRVFPNVLSKVDDDRDNRLPIQHLAYIYEGTPHGNISKCNLYAVSFIPLLVRLAIEFGLFEKERIGGLLSDDDDDLGGFNIFKHLTLTDSEVISYDSEQHHELVDDKCLFVMKQLRQMGYLKKEDIKRYDLLNRRLSFEYKSMNIFPQNRFRFLVEWDPTLLLHPNTSGCTPLYYAALLSDSIRRFQVVFEYGLLYYPNKKGINLLFREDDCDNTVRTPFQVACVEHGQDEVMKVIEETISRCYSSSSSSSSDNSTPPPTLNIVEALITAAIDENIHLDCINFLLRREPDILQKLLLQSLPTTTTTTTTTSLTTSGSNDDDIIINNINNRSNNSRRSSSSSSTDNNDDNNVNDVKDDLLLETSNTCNLKKRKLKEKKEDHSPNK